MRKGLAAVLVAAVVAALAVGIASWWAGRQGPASVPAEIAVRKYRPGELMTVTPPVPAPSIAFLDGDGRETTLAAFKGKTVVVNLWATWCPPCVKEMPSLDRLSKALGGPDFAVVALSQDRSLDLVKTFYDTYLLDNLASYLDRSAGLGRALGASGLPTTYVLDPQGRVVAAMEGGAEWDSPAMIARLRSVASPSLNPSQP